jgi:hypothetical protein
MANIYVEGKGPQGIQAKESLLPAAVAGYTRGLAVTYGVDQFHAALVAAAGSPAIGLLEEDAININNPASVIQFGQAVAQIGANVVALQPLTTNAAGQLVPATAGQPVTAIALEPQNYVAPGSYATVFVVAILGITMPGSDVNYYAAAGALAVPEGDTTAVVNGAAALAMTLVQPTASMARSMWLRSPRRAMAWCSKPSIRSGSFARLWEAQCSRSTAPWTVFSNLN